MIPQGYDGSRVTSPRPLPRATPSLMDTARFTYALLPLAMFLGCRDSDTPGQPPISLWSSPLTTPGLFFQGNNLSGAERGFGSAIEENWGAAIPGTEGQTYWWPMPADNPFPDGMNIVRLPFQWERLQPVLSGDFDPSYLGRLHETANAWRDRGFNVLLDVHNYAHYKVNGRGTTQPGQLIGTALVPAAALADFWRRMALEFGSESTSSPFIFGLMNEPHDIDVSVWVGAAQQAVTAIRDTGAKNPLFVPGADWTTAHDFSWSQNANLLSSVIDPLDNMAIEVHQYYDGDCSPNSYIDRLAPFEQWAISNNRVAFLGETDLTDESEACREAFANMVAHLHATAAGAPGGVWVGFTYWQGEELSTALPQIQPHLPSTCANGVMDGNETDVDCGSTCLRCDVGLDCTADFDCRSGFCTDGQCSDATGEGGATNTGQGGAATTGEGGATAPAAGGAATTGEGGATAPGAGGLSDEVEAGSSEEKTSDSGCGCRITTRTTGFAWATVFAALALARRKRALRQG